MTMTREKIWKCTNIDSLTCVRHDDVSIAHDDQLRMYELKD